MLELYHNWNSTCSLKVRIALAEKGLEWKGHHLDLKALQQLEPAFLELNPAGMVPVLVHDGVAINESMVINEYLDDAFPEISLRPAEPTARARMRAWTLYVTVEPSWAIKAPSYQKNLRPVLAGTKSDAEFAAMAARMPDQQNAARWVTAATRGFNDEELGEQWARLAKTLDRMEASLKEGAWLAGAGYSLADIDMAPFVHRIAVLGQANLIGMRPQVADWYARIKARPAFTKALAPT